jgi:hypothetical protein
MLPGGGPPAIRPGRADPRFRANGERITVREEPKEVDQGLARSAKEGLFSVFHPVNEERFVFVNPSHVVRLQPRD